MAGRRREGPARLGSRTWNAPHELCVEHTRKALGDHRFRDAFDRGADHGQDIDQAIAYVLGDERAPSAAARQTSADEVLTAREVRVAELISEGLTNRQVATRLVISLRTAETHVDHVLTKLGFTSRTRIAAWVVEHRPD